MADELNIAVNLKHLEKIAVKAKAAIAAAVADLPVEMFLDATQTKFEQSFKFTAEKYPGATDPSLEDKPVLVLVIKGVDNSAPTDTTKQTTTYSFLDMSKLVDTYKAKTGDSAKILNIAGYEIEFKISEDDGNIIQVKEDGMFATTAVAGAVQGNIAVFDANGKPSDSGIRFATDDEVDTVLNGVFGTTGSGD